MNINAVYRLNQHFWIALQLSWVIGIRRMAGYFKEDIMIMARSHAR